MNNADMPAMPTAVIDTHVDELMEGGGRFHVSNGLTKLEHFAGLAMQGLVTAQDEDGTWAHDSKTVASTAVSYAKALLAELDKVSDDE